MANVDQNLSWLQKIASLAPHCTFNTTAFTSNALKKFGQSLNSNLTVMRMCILFGPRKRKSILQRWT
jgi:hypothetical protein